MSPTSLTNENVVPTVYKCYLRLYIFFLKSYTKIYNLKFFLQAQP